LHPVFVGRWEPDSGVPLRLGRGVAEIAMADRRGATSFPGVFDLALQMAAFPEAARPDVPGKEQAGLGVMEIFGLKPEERQQALPRRVLQRRDDDPVMRLAARVRCLAQMDAQAAHQSSALRAIRRACPVPLPQEQEQWLPAWELLVRALPPDCSEALRGVQLQLQDALQSVARALARIRARQAAWPPQPQVPRDELLAQLARAQLPEQLAWLPQREPRLSSQASPSRQSLSQPCPLPRRLLEPPDSGNASAQARHGSNRESSSESSSR